MRLGIDIGGTKAHAVALGPHDEVAAEVRLPSGQGAAEVVRTVRAAVARLATATGSAPVSLGIGIPGTVDPATGLIQHAVNLGIERLDLAHALDGLVAGPVRVDNDVNAAALGACAALRSEGAAPASMAYLNVGTGIAAGLVLDGRVWRGHRGIAGEIGHLPVDPAGLPCPCGQRGCLETVASGLGLARWSPSSAGLAAALEAGDARATAMWRALVHGVADAAQILFLAVGVETVVLGGGVASNPAGLVPAVRAELAGRAERSPFVASLDLAARVRALPGVVPVPALGAALLAAPPHPAPPPPTPP